MFRTPADGRPRVTSPAPLPGPQVMSPLALVTRRENPSASSFTLVTGSVVFALVCRVDSVVKLGPPVKVGEPETVGLPVTVPLTAAPFTVGVVRVGVV